MAYSTAQIRNVALAGHSGSGKTTLFEALLQAGGAIQAAGSVERGSTVSDFDPMEKTRGHSLNTAIASTDHAGIHVNLIDTPGFADFRGPTLSAFSAVSTVWPPAAPPLGPMSTVAVLRKIGSLLSHNTEWATKPPALLAHKMVREAS